MKLLLIISVKFDLRPKTWSGTVHKLRPTSRRGDAYGVWQTAQCKILPPMYLKNLNLLDFFTQLMYAPVYMDECLEEL